MNFKRKNCCLNVNGDGGEMCAPNGRRVANGVVHVYD